MSPISNFGVLALASAVLAIPHIHENHHQHLHARQALPTAIPAAPPAPAVGNAPVPDVGSAPVPYSGGGALSGKRGVIYNDASAAQPYLGSNLFGWAANWISTSDGLGGGVSYIPTLHNGDSDFTSSWHADAQNAINNGAQYLFGPNEPDIESQANMSPEACAQVFKQYLTPYKDQVTLVAPAVSNSASPGQGLDWLKQFMALCQDCGIGAVNQHWYDTSSNDVSYFQQQISSAHSQTGLPVFVGEFGFIGSDSDISEALNQVMGWMDANPAVLGYAYFMAADGYLNDGGSPSPYGLTYLNN